VSSVDGFLDELSTRAGESGGALAVKLPRAPGAREARWSHLLCGAVDVSQLPQATDDDQFVASTELAALKAQQWAMQQHIEQLHVQVEKLYAELGLSTVT
jgi:uncharacterized protein